MGTNDTELHALIASLEEEQATLHERTEAIDDWANGVMSLHLLVLPLLLEANPELAARVMPALEEAETQRDRALAGHRTEMPLHWYDPRAVAASVCRSRGIASPNGRAALPDLPPTRLGPRHNARGREPRPRRTE